MLVPLRPRNAIDELEQTVSGEAAISTIFCANTIADAGACSAGQVIRGSGVCAGFVKLSSFPQERRQAL